MKSLSVLVVDDDEQMLALVEYWLAEAGYDVVACSRFEAAHSYLATHSMDALIADIRLGAFNGLQLALRVCHEGRTAVLIMSAYDDVVARRDAAACGGRFMLKPLDRESLLAELTAALATTAARSATAALTTTAAPA